MDPQAAWRWLGRLALMVGAALLGTAGFFSLLLGGCDWIDGRFCGGDVGLLLEGYVAGGALMGGAAALAARACTRRWSLVLATGSGAVVLSALVVLAAEL